MLKGTSVPALPAIAPPGVLVPVGSEGLRVAVLEPGGPLPGSGIVDPPEGLLPVVRLPRREAGWGIPMLKEVVPEPVVGWTRGGQCLALVP